MIPLNSPELLGMERKYLEEVAYGKVFVGPCEELLEGTFGGRVLLTPSGTAALELAAMMIPKTRGTRAIMPTFTFSSTANAFLRADFNILFVDSRADTFNIDEEQINVSHDTAVIVPVHYAGVGCSMSKILNKANGIPIVEDNAHGIFGRMNGQLLGTFGDMAALSFHQTKNFQCGEGGALIISSGDWRKAERIRDKGTDRSAMLRGEAQKYEWTDLGSSFVMSEISAAFLLAQLEAREYVATMRKQRYRHYMRSLEDWMIKVDAKTQSIPASCEPTYHIFPILMPDQERRDLFLEHLKRRGIGSAFHYIPLHLSSMGRSLGYKAGQFPVAESIASRLVRLPIYPGLNRQQMDAIIRAVEAFT